ncbi:MAG: DNA (cytosine-5-)-methyltransferase [Actinomycetota bacterium]|nr:DNA (cytosine-5-)-methyltransferase [Actinomycetota bacterium]
MKETPLDTRALLSRIDELLETRYRSGDLGNVDDPLAETVYILLSKQTQEPVYQRIYRELRHRYPRWVDVLAAPDEELIELLRPAGLYAQRAMHLKVLLDIVDAENRVRGIGPYARRPSDLTLDFLNDLSDEDAEAFLVSLPGVGPKSARCVLAYSLERAAFAVDTHVHRIFNRLGLVPSSGRKKDHDPFQDAVPAAMRKRLHINLIHHGRAVCQTQNAKCGECILVSFCGPGRKAVAADERPAAVDLFAGAGGLGYGFRQAGYRVALAVEHDHYAAQTYRLNNPGVPVIEAAIDDTTTAADLRRYMPGVKKVTTLLAGPPCQGYSAAGARDPHAEINLLYRHVARLGKELMAQTICLENVPGVRRVNGRGFLNSILDALREAGFATEAHLVHACEYGVPQHRARYFFLGRRGRGTAPSAPKPTHIPRHDDVAGNDLPRTPRLKDLLDALPQFGPGIVCEYLRGEKGEEHFNLSTMAHGAWVIEKIRRIRPGQGPISYRRLEADEARTLIAGHRALPVHPTRHRSISAREAAVIQGFPPNYVFCGPRGRQPLQIANAVPPPLAEAIAKHLSKIVAQPPRLRNTG